MIELADIYTYIGLTKFASNIEPRYHLSADKAIAVSHMPDKIDAVSLAFCYGRAKGYRAAKAEIKRGKAD